MAWQENTPAMCATYYLVQSKEGQSPLWKCLGYPPGLRGWMHNPLKLWLIYDSSHNTHATLMQHSCNTYATPMQHTYVVSSCFWTNICDPKWLLDTKKRDNQESPSKMVSPWEENGNIQPRNMSSEVCQEYPIQGCPFHSPGRWRFPRGRSRMACRSD